MENIEFISKKALKNGIECYKKEMNSFFQKVTYPMEWETFFKEHKNVVRNCIHIIENNLNGAKTKITTQPIITEFKNELVVYNHKGILIGGLSFDYYKENKNRLKLRHKITLNACWKEIDNNGLFHSNQNIDLELLKKHALEDLKNSFYKNLREEPEKSEAFDEWVNELQLEDLISMHNQRASLIIEKEDTLNREKAQFLKLRQEMNKEIESEMERMENAIEKNINIFEEKKKIKKGSFFKNFVIKFNNWRKN